MRRALIASCLLSSGLLAACATTPEPQPTGLVAVITDPPGATISFVDGSTCQTPCEVTVPVPMAIVVGKAGYKAVRADLAPTDGPRVTYVLEPVGRSAPAQLLELGEDLGG